MYVYLIKFKKNVAVVRILILFKNFKGLTVFGIHVNLSVHTYMEV